MEMQKSGEMTKEMKHIKKPLFSKLEKFVAEKIEAKLRFDSLDEISMSRMLLFYLLTSDRTL